MAKIPDQTLDIIFQLQRSLITEMNEAAIETIIYERFGETEITLPILEQLQNIRERLMNPYSRICALLPRIANYQPAAPVDVLNLLYRTIDQAQGAKDASVASLQEVKRDFNLL